MIPVHPVNEEDTAYHEAGHAVGGAARGRPPLSVTIIPDGGIAGRNDFPADGRPEFQNFMGDSPEKRAYIETRILIEVAGTAAHDLRFPERDHDAGDAHDTYWARRLIEDNAGWVAASDRENYLQQHREAARELLRTNWAWVEAVARALIEHKTISAVEVMALRPPG